MKLKFILKKKWELFLVFSIELLAIVDSAGYIRTNNYKLFLITVVTVPIIASQYLKIKSGWIFFIALLQILLIPVFLHFGYTSLSEKVAVWSYYIMLSGVLAGLLEMLKINFLKKRK